MTPVFSSLPQHDLEESPGDNPGAHDPEPTPLDLLDQPAPHQVLVGRVLGIESLQEIPDPSLEPVPGLVLFDENHPAARPENPACLGQNTVPHLDRHLVQGAADDALVEMTVGERDFLGVALEELKVYGARYAYQVISNAKALARMLDEGGLPVRFRERDYTESHQMMLDTTAIEERTGLDPQGLAIRLEEQDIIVDAMCRVGTNEMTRRGMTEADMEPVAELVVRAAGGEDVKAEVHDLVEGRELEFVLD